MNTERDLLEVEKQLWSGDAAAYRQHLDETCLIVFPSMAGMMSREQVASSVEGSPRWQDLQISQTHYLQLDDQAVVLSYRARAKRPDDENYEARVSSAYVKRGAGWKLSFHQHTPLHGD